MGRRGGRLGGPWGPVLACRSSGGLDPPPVGRGPRERTDSRLLEMPAYLRKKPQLERKPSCLLSLAICAVLGVVLCPGGPEPRCAGRMPISRQPGGPESGPGLQRGDAAQSPTSMSAGRGRAEHDRWGDHRYNQSKGHCWRVIPDLLGDTTGSVPTATPTFSPLQSHIPSLAPSLRGILKLCLPSVPVGECSSSFSTPTPESSALPQRISGASKQAET